MKTQQHFSIVIPLYNKKHYIERALKSVLSQTYQQFEIIVVNDGSDDEGELVAESYKSNNITVINQKNSGVSIARNTGILAAEYDFVCLLDADDEWMPNFLEEIATLINDFPHGHIFSLRHEIIDSDGQMIYPKVRLAKDFRGVIKNFTQLFAKSNGLINASTVCLRKNYYFQLGGFPSGQNHGEDIYLWLLYDLTTDLVFSNQIGSRYYRNTSNRSIDRFTVEELPYHFIYFYKLMKRLDFVPAHGQGKKNELNHYLRKQAFAHIAQLVFLEKRDLATAHVALLSDLNKLTGWLCYFVVLLPNQVIKSLKVIRIIKRLNP